MRKIIIGFIMILLLNTTSIAVSHLTTVKQAGDAQLGAGDTSQEATINGSAINAPMGTSQPLSYEKLPNPFLFLKGVEDEATIKEVADIALTPIAQLVYALLLKVGIAICLVVMTIYGFMWITATPQKRADLKQSIAPVLTGLFILIAGIGPAAQIVDLVNNAFTTSTTTTALIDNTAGAIAGLVQTIGISVALIILLSTGVQFITASPNKRVEIRGRITNIIIGVAIIILTSTILNVVISQISSMK